MSRSILITGANGFVGKNLRFRLSDAGVEGVIALGREATPEAFDAAVAGADVIFHLAGANRPPSDEEFQAVNHGLTERLAGAVRAGGRKPLIVYTSSTKATEPSAYGGSKKAAEDVLLALGASGDATACIQRLPNLFGKWARPNYNSAVATFCHNIARDLPIQVQDPAAPLTLLYIDDLIDDWLAMLSAPPVESGFVEPTRTYVATVGEVADRIAGFARGRQEAMIDAVGTGLIRALYATYISYLPNDAFAYPLVDHVDPRGAFTEFLKTPDHGQMSFLTAHPGVTRGGHYHHTKTEKFLVVQGDALFRFRNVLTDEYHEVRTTGDRPVVVETIPGWSHDITNVGDGLMISLLWANELFDRARPDTIAAKVAE